jgi:alpha-N-arabinofuranosidase
MLPRLPLDSGAALHAYGSPSYYAQVLFAKHLGDHTVETKAEGVNRRFFWSATVSTSDRVLHLKLVNAPEIAQPLTADITDLKAGTATLYTLHAATRWSTNSIDRPGAIVPVTSKVTIEQGWKHVVPGNSIEVIDIPLQ